MTTNKIQEQLEKKSKQEIEELVKNLVKDIIKFRLEKTGFKGNGMNWYSEHTKPQQFVGETLPDPFDFLDWDNLHRLFRRNIQEKMLDDMVDQKASNLIAKMELL